MVVVPVGEGKGIGKAYVVVGATEHDGVDLAAVLARERADKATQGIVGSACLSADVAVRAQDFVALDHRDVALGAIGAGNVRHVIGGCGNSAKVLVAHGVGEHGRDVACGGVHVCLPAVKVETMGVGELASHIQFLGLFVHGIDENTVGVVGGGVDDRADRARNRHAGVVSRGDEERAQGSLERHGVALFEVRRGLAYGRGGVVDGNGGIERCVVERHDSGHDLGDRGDFCLIIGSTLVIDGAVLTHHDGVGSRDVGTICCGVLTLGFGGAADDIGVGLIGQCRRGHSGDAQGTKKRCHKGREAKVQGVMAGAHNRSLSFDMEGNASAVAQRLSV